MKIKSIEVVSIQCPSATSLSESLTYAGRSGQFFLDMTLGIRMKPNYRICKLSGQRILSINSQEVKKLSHSSSQTIQQREILSTQPKLTTPPKVRRISMFSRIGTLFLAFFLFITLLSLSDWQFHWRGFDTRCAQLAVAVLGWSLIDDRKTILVAV